MSVAEKKKKKRLFSRFFKYMKKFVFRNRLVGPLLSGSVTLFLKVLFKTYRITVDGKAPSGPKIMAFWHQRLFAMIDHFSTYPDPQKGVVISSSVDGDFIASIAERFGYTPIRKPRHSQGNGVRLTKEVIKLLRDGGGLAIIPDGPKGPPGEVPAGLVKLAATCNAPVIPSGYSATFKLVFPSWDRFILPLPCSRVHIVHGPPIYITNGSAEQVELKRIELQKGIHEATATADRHLGQRHITVVRSRRSG
ncbi:MAG: DUF374 domain-containing protein [Planctomycetota bacterium]